MFRNNKASAWAVALILLILSSAAFAGVSDYNGTWEGDGTGQVQWGIYTIEPFYDWIMYLSDGVIEGSWEDGPAYGSMDGSVNSNGYATGTWDMDYPYTSPQLHGTWTATFDEDGTMEGDWWYYNTLSQLIYGGDLEGYRYPGIPD